MVAKTEVPGRQKVFGPVLLCPGFPGLENGFLALWAVFWGAESEFEVRFSKFGRLGFCEFSMKKTDGGEKRPYPTRRTTNTNNTRIPE